MDIEAIKAQYDLRAEVERDLGQPVKTSGKWQFWRCPFHADGDPSFGVDDTGGFHCFGCGKSGDIITWLTEYRRQDWKEIFQQNSLDETQARILKLEYQQRELERRQAEHEKRLSALERIHACTDHRRYFDNLQMHTEAIEYWCSQGMELDTIDRYMLGYCPRCPTDTEQRASYTIPVISNGQLWNIRHRLIGADNGDKYRPHMAGLPNVLFNADYLRARTDTMLITEGEKKSIVAAQLGFINVGVMGKSGFDAGWVGKFDHFKIVYICYDSDARAQAIKDAQLFGRRGRVVHLPGKLDDLIVKHGMTPDDLRGFMELATKV